MLLVESIFIGTVLYHGLQGGGKRDREEEDRANVEQVEDETSAFF